MVAYSFKKRFAWPIKIGLGLAVPDSFGSPTPKQQTIRAVGKRRHARRGETLQLYTGMRTKQCQKIGEAICKSVGGIRLYLAMDRIEIPGRHELQRGTELDSFARDDGFSDWTEMREFWREEHGDLARLSPFVGVLVKWEPKPKEKTDE